MLRGTSPIANMAAAVGILGMENGGTGMSSMPAGVVVSTGTGLAIAPVNLTDQVSGVLPVANGGAPQDLSVAASPTFAGLTVDALSGPVRATAGVVSTGPINLATETTGALPYSAYSSATERVVPVNLGTVNISAGSGMRWILLDPAGGLAVLTINLPPNPADRDMVCMFTSKAILSVTLGVQTGAVGLVGGLTSFLLGGSFWARYYASTGYWYRVAG